MFRWSSCGSSCRNGCGSRGSGEKSCTCDHCSRGGEEEGGEGAVLHFSEEWPAALNAVAKNASIGDLTNPEVCRQPSKGRPVHARKSEKRKTVTSEDLVLSQKLEHDLGLRPLHAAAAKLQAVEASLLGNRASGGPTFYTLTAVVAKTKGLLERRLLVETPSFDDIHRGVHIQTVYDYFTVADKAVRKRKMAGHVFHHRDEGLTRSRTGSGGDRRGLLRSGTERSDCSDVDETSSRSSADTVSSRGSRPQTPPGKSEQRPSRKWGQRQPPIHPEVLARWGVLAGRVIHSKVVDFTRATDKAVRRKRCQDNVKAKGVGAMFHSVRERARVVVQQASYIAKRLSKADKDLFDSEWREEDLLVHLFSREYIDMLALFASTARKILAVQPTLVEAMIPCRIFGDIHGQFRDLLLLFEAFGSPDERDAPVFVFNGDFVDRGKHQLEVVGLLLALKVLLPEKVWLLRGNHEDRAMNQKYGFADECNEKLGMEFGPKIFEFIQDAFDQLPLACIVADRVLVVHGGIGDGAWRVCDLRGVKRPLGGARLGEPENAWIYNMLWSDPIEDDAAGEQTTFGVHESPRGGGATRFGWDVTKTFCALNGLGLIVRSHQSKQDSLGFDIMHENLLVRVFSARDYERHGNDGAVLLITRGQDEHKLLTVTPQILRSTSKAIQQQLRDEAEAAAIRIQATFRGMRVRSASMRIASPVAREARPQPQQPEVKLKEGRRRGRLATTIA